MIKIRVNGRPVAIEALCNAVSRPPNNSAIAHTPSIAAQKMRCATGELSVPPDVRWSTTNEPESEEVTKKITTRVTPTKEVTAVNGKFSSMTNKAVETSSFTTDAISAVPKLSKLRAEPPRVLIHINESRVGFNITPIINSLTVRPFETRAINMPTKGDQDIHHPQ